MADKTHNISQQEVVAIEDGALIAAVDLGSNSFHMVVARIEQGAPRVIDRLRDSVRLAAGLGDDGNLEPAQHAQAMHCLARMGQRLAGWPPERVRAVATNTVRRLAEPQAFLDAAAQALGHSVEIVSGVEEGRLVFLGASHDLPVSNEPRLIIDIGGGSTEFILGQNTTPQRTESVQAGCIASTRRFFPNGKITRKRWLRARDEIGLILQQFAGDYCRAGWQEAYGSSGTAKALASVARALRPEDEAITPAALAAIREAILAQEQIENLKLPGLSDERQAIFPGGVVIMETAFAALGIETMCAIDSSMREGLLWDLIGRASGHDPRTASIDALAIRHGVDAAQAHRVETTARMLIEQIEADWQLREETREWLCWAARIHEIGLVIAHSQHHHHGAYILRHADLAGFSRQDQQLLAAIVENHRRKPNPQVYLSLSEHRRPLALKITALLRLAALFHRARQGQSLPPLRLKATLQTLHLSLPAVWLERHPLTAADLAKERQRFATLGLQLEVTIA